MAFTTTVALLTGLVFGVVLTVQSTRGNLGGVIAAGGRGGSGGRATGRLRSGFIVAEMAFAVMLLVGAGLLTRSFLALTAVDPGFMLERTVAFRVSLPSAVYPESAARPDFFNALRERVESLPGVNVTGGVSALPLMGGGDLLGFSIESRERTEDQVWEIRSLSVMPGYFQAMGIPLQRGRLLTEHDRWEAPSVVLINEAAVERWFPDDDPVG